MVLINFIDALKITAWRLVSVCNAALAPDGSTFKYFERQYRRL